jgi:heme o synthase
MPNFIKTFYHFIYSKVQHNTHQVAIKSAFSQKISDYGILLKFRLSLLVVFSAAIGYLFALTGSIDWARFGLLCLGGFMVTGASTALNQVFEKDVDALMPRTQDRPVAAGRMSATEALLAAGILSVIGLGILSSFNMLTAVLGALSLLSYAFVYTPLKKITPIAVLVGAFPGAFPTMIGWAAVTGTISQEALTLFAMQFIWQFPHFWSIAWKAYDDYAKAGFYLLPNGKKDKNSAFQVVLYCVFLIIVSWFPYFIGMSGITSSLIVFATCIYFLYTAIQLYKNETDKAALTVMFASFIYLPVSQIAFLLDKI